MPRVSFDTEEPARSPLRRPPPLWFWGAIALVGFLIFELTAEPALSFSAVCLRYAWEDLRTAWWLRRNDDWPVRARVLGWFLLARGLARVGIAAFAVVLCWVFLSIAIEQRKGVVKPAGQPLPMPAWFPAVALMMLAGILGTTLCSTLGVWTSRRARLPVWLDPVLHTCSAERRWPPAGNEFGQVNLIDLPWLGVLAGWLTLLLVGTLWGAIGLHEILRRHNIPGAHLIATAAVFLIGSTGIGLIAWAMSGVRAHTPAECWQRPPSSSSS